MATSQTVFINIVVRGGMDKAPVAAAQQATNQITNVATVSQRTTQQIISQITNLLGITRSTTLSINNIGTAAQNAGQRVARSNSFMARTFATLQKAIVSMIGVMIFWTAFITIPEMIITGIARAFMAAVKAVADLEQRILALQAVLASTVKFSDDPIKNFITAGKVADEMMDMILRRGAEMVGTLDEAAAVLQTGLASGLTRYVKNTKEAVDVTLLLVNSIGAVTLGQDRMRQLTSETRQLLLGQLPPTATLARLLFKNADEAKKFLAHAREGRTLAEDLKKKLEGFVLAVQPFGMTLRGIVTSFQDLGIMLSKWSLTPFIKQVKEVLDTFRKTFYSEITKTVPVIEEVNGKIIARQEEVLGMIPKAAAALGALVQVFFEQVLEAIGVDKNAFTDFFQYIIANADVIGGKIAWWITLLGDLGTIIKAVALVFIGSFKSLVALIEWIVEGLSDICTWLLNVGIAFNNLIPGTTKRDFYDLKWNAKLYFQEMAEGGEMFVDGLKAINNLKSPAKAQLEAQQRTRDLIKRNTEDIKVQLKIQQSVNTILAGGAKGVEAQIQLHKDLEGAANKNIANTSKVVNDINNVTNTAATKYSGLVEEVEKAHTRIQTQTKLIATSAGVLAVTVAEKQRKNVEDIDKSVDAASKKIMNTAKDLQRSGALRGNIELDTTSAEATLNIVRQGIARTYKDALAMGRGIIDNVTDTYATMFSGTFDTVRLLYNYGMKVGPEIVKSLGDAARRAYDRFQEIVKKPVVIPINFEVKAPSANVTRQVNEVVDVANKAKDALGGLASITFDPLSDKLRATFRSLSGSSMEVTNAIIDDFTNAGTRIVETIDSRLVPYLQKLGFSAERGVDSTVEYVVAALGSIPVSVTGSLDALSGKFASTYDYINRSSMEVSDAIVSDFAGVGDNIVNAIKKAFSGLADISLDPLSDKLRTAFKSFEGSSYEVSSAIIADFNDLATNIVESISKVTPNIATSVLDPLSESFRHTFRSFTGSSAEVSANITDDFTKLANNIINALRKIHVSLPELSMLPTVVNFESTTEDVKALDSAIKGVQETATKLGDLKWSVAAYPEAVEVARTAISDLNRHVNDGVTNLRTKFGDLGTFIKMFAGDFPAILKGLVPTNWTIPAPQVDTSSTSASFANLWNSIKDGMKNVVTEASELKNIIPILPPITAAFDTTHTSVNGLADSLDRVRTTSESLEPIRNIIAKVGDAWKYVSDSFKSASDFGTFRPVIISQIDDVISAIKTKITSVDWAAIWSYTLPRYDKQLFNSFTYGLDQIKIAADNVFGGIVGGFNKWRDSAVASNAATADASTTTVSWLQKIRDVVDRIVTANLEGTIKRTSDNIGNASKSSGVWSGVLISVKNLLGTIGDIINPILAPFGTIFKTARTDANNFAASLDRIKTSGMVSDDINRGLHGTYDWFVKIKDIVGSILGSFSGVEGTYEGWKHGVESVAEAFNKLWDAIKNIPILPQGFKEFINEVGALLDKLVAKFEESMPKIATALKTAAADVGSRRTTNEWLVSTQQGLNGVANAAERVNRGMGYVHARIAKLPHLSSPPTEFPAGTTEEAITDAQRRTLERMKRDIDLLWAGENEVLKIEIRRKENAAELAIQFADAPQHLAQALKLNNDLEDMELRQLHRKTMEGTIAELQNRITAAISGYNEFAAAENRIEIEAEKLKRTLAGQNDELYVALGLLKQAMFQELKAGLVAKAEAAEAALLKEQYGEAYSIEQDRLDTLIAIYQMQRLSVDEQNALADAVNREAGARQAALLNARTKRAAAEILDLNAQLEKVAGRTTAVRDVELQQIELEARLSREYKDQQIELGIMLGIVADIFAYRREQAALEDRMRETQLRIDTSRGSEESLRTQIEDYVNLRDTWQNVRIAAAQLEVQIMLNNERLEVLRNTETKSAADAAQLAEEIRQLEAANRSAQGVIDNTTGVLQRVDIEMQRSQNAIDKWLRGAGTALDAMKGIAIEAALMIGQGMGSAITDMFQAILNGESALGAFKKMIGSILIQLGEMCVTMGTMSLIMAAIPWLNFTTNVPAALALIAIGVAAIAAGVALGGAGGKTAKSNATGSETPASQPAPIFVSNRDILVQQGIWQALDDNTKATLAMTGEVSRLSKENGDTLVQKTIKKKPSIVSAPLRQQFSNSYYTASKVGSAMLGET